MLFQFILLNNKILYCFALFINIFVMLHCIYRSIGFESLSILDGNEPFSAKGFTMKASGLNCTWSMEARITGFASSSTREVITARLAALGTGHSTSLGSWYPSTIPLGLASSVHLVEAEAFFTLSGT